MFRGPQPRAETSTSVQSSARRIAFDLSRRLAGGPAYRDSSLHSGRGGAGGFERLPDAPLHCGREYNDSERTPIHYGADGMDPGRIQHRLLRFSGAGRNAGQPLRNARDSSRIERAVVDAGSLDRFRFELHPDAALASYLRGRAGRSRAQHGQDHQRLDSRATKRLQRRDDRGGHVDWRRDHDGPDSHAAGARSLAHGVLPVLARRNRMGLRLLRYLEGKTV